MMSITWFSWADLLSIHQQSVYSFGRYLCRKRTGRLCTQAMIQRLSACFKYGPFFVARRHIPCI